MKDGPDIALVASLLGDPARANMLTALMAGQALTAGELAREAGVTAQTASGHLARLEAGGLIVGRRQGRHAYFALSGHDVAEVLEALTGLAARTGPKEPALRRARVCYDHLAGDLGVALLDGLISSGMLLDDETLTLTPAGETRMAGLGIDTAALRKARRPVCKRCLDWSVRRSHLAGSLGAALLQRIYALGWGQRVEGSRIVAFTPAGLAAFEAAFGPLPQAA
ncbi:ArsR/SmtB family transcription factor [Caulobacter mirabilis]|uniref:Transcriptional regulator n=1 Tax=Caulobacter mirabilis TaxID=69666 RepID=A0A2D2B2I5_9CAUL|nr:winged helix-turn-helix domain-containing protein [Caulobacter mirabilis]ATQ44426.1 transcriptional regulator [Caulobacter mirabilis]